jgi:hypothetical protein
MFVKCDPLLLHQALTVLGQKKIDMCNAMANALLRTISLGCQVISFRDHFEAHQMEITVLNSIFILDGITWFCSTCME